MSTALRLVLLLSAVFCGFVVQASAQGVQDLRQLTLEQLGNIEVTTVSRSSDTQAHTPAAVFVITQEDIRRSGATSIPEALRLAPGVHVARIDSTRWAIGIRGFADRLSRSMLVLIDGRAVYSPLFAGTYWEVQDTLLQDIDRIEVIRGPGGTLWGANAINGIVNIITKAAAETQGPLITGDGGSAEYGSAGVRYGGGDADVRYRAYGKVVNRGPAFHADGDDFDHWRAEQGGFRVDVPLARERSFTVQGDVYHARSGQRAALTTFTSPYVELATADAELSGANVLARWSSPPTDSTGFQLQTYYDRTDRDEIPVKETRDTFDIDFQQTRTQWPGQELVWGLAYRATSDRIAAVAPTAFVPERRTDHLASAFVQDDITVVPERVRVVVGARVEHNSYSGFEVQPSGRVLWTPSATNTVIGSVTRAVRTPSRVETDYTTATYAGLNVLPIFVRLQPNPAFEPEKLVAYEVGYRLQPVAPLYLTVSSFYNALTDVVSTELMTPFLETTPPPHLVLPVTFGNGLQGSNYGAEITADWRPTPWWRVAGYYAYLRVVLSKIAGSTDVSQEAAYEGLSPRHQWQVRSSVDIARGWSVDAFLRSVSELPAGPVPSYETSTVRIAWRPTESVELAVVGQDLHQPNHREWASGDIEIPRRGYATVTWGW